MLPVFQFPPLLHGRPWVVTGDVIRLPDGERERLVGNRYEKGRLTLDHALRFEAGQGVHLDFAGRAPDIGAYETPRG